MSSKISTLPAAAPLTGGEQLPAVQSGGNVKTSTLALANLVASVPAGVDSFRVLNFGGCSFQPNNDETINLYTPSQSASAIAFMVDDGAGGLALLGCVGGRPWNGAFIYSNGQPFGLENVGGLNINWHPVFDDVGNLLDDYGDILFNRTIEPQNVADATSPDDVVARFNDLLVALRARGFIAS